MFSVLEGIDSVDDERVGHLIEKDHLIDDRVDAFFHDDSNIKKVLLCFGYLFHCVYLLGLFILYFPDAPEPSWTYLVYEVV